jgi:hypothetical protein
MFTLVWLAVLLFCITLEQKGKNNVKDYDLKQAQNTKN